MVMKTQWVAFKTIVRKEWVRIARIWTQTLLPPIITQTLYFVIFGKFIGSQVGDMQGVSYMAFIVPGLVMMSVINNSYGNVVSSFFGSKFQRNIEELLVSPVQTWVIVLGYAIGGMIRGIVVGCLVFAVSAFFTRPVIQHMGVIVLFMVMTSITFSLGGMLNAIFAKKFDDIAIIPNFVLTPLIYLGGVFYSIHKLPSFWQTVSHFNPILYMVNGFRYGFYGISDVSLGVSIVVLCLFMVALAGINLFLLEKGYGMKS